MQCEGDQRLQLSVRDENGEHSLSVAPGDTLLSALQDNGIAIGAVCGGGMICGTCHVFIRTSDKTLPIKAGEDETDLLELSGFYDASASRLACQVVIGAELAAAAIEVAPDE